MQIPSPIQNADNPADAVCSLTQNWWLFALRGIFALIFAVLAFWMPHSALFAMTIVFGAFSLVNGAFNLVAAVRQMRQKQRWGWLLFSGIVGILTGVVVVVAPLAATLALAYFLWVSVAFWAIFTGMLEISAAVRLRREIKAKSGLPSAGCFRAPRCDHPMDVFYPPDRIISGRGLGVGFHAAIFGMTLLLLSWRLRKARQR
jgi:uncharacterized membrane protein HdeD (DUF308 family)